MRDFANPAMTTEQVCLLNCTGAKPLEKNHTVYLSKWLEFGSSLLLIKICVVSYFFIILFNLKRGN